VVAGARPADGHVTAGRPARRRSARRARLAEYRPNPAHRRAKLLACTEAGYWAVRQITLVQHPWAERVGAAVGTDELRAALASMRRLVEVLET
jgi:DNA-binding MarR family transcriptional regulator